MSGLNQEGSYELPISATYYIVNKNKEIIFSFVDEDYKKRLELQSVSLNADEAIARLDNDEARVDIINQKKYWLEKGISAVPTIIFNDDITLNGDLPLGTYKQFIDIRSCVVVATDYRKSIKTHVPAGFNDFYDTLWSRK